MCATLGPAGDGRLPLSAIQAETPRLQEACCARLATLTDDDLAKPMEPPAGIELPEFLKTLGQALGALPVQKGHHNGEISLLRRLLGRPGVM